MSADNGLLVHRLSDNSGRIGIFHYFASDDSETPAEYWSEKNSIRTHSDLETAMLDAHVLQLSEQTEYGVSVDPTLLNPVMQPRSLKEFEAWVEQELPGSVVQILPPDEVWIKTAYQAKMKYDLPEQPGESKTFERNFKYVLVPRGKNG